MKTQRCSLGAPLESLFQGGRNMKITVVGRQMTVRESLKEMVEAKLSKLDKFFGGNADATVTFSCKRNKECLEITITAMNTLFRYEAAEDTFQTSLDRAIDAIERQIRKNKTRLEKRLRDSSFSIPEGDFEDIEEESEFRIRTKTFSIKPMSVEEAILQMNLLGHQFFVFEDMTTGDTCVVYTRRDGDYGLIVPTR